MPASWDEKVRKCSWVDMQFIKLSVFAFALMIAKLWSPILSLEWYWYAAIFILAMIKPVAKALGK